MGFFGKLRKKDKYNVIPKSNIPREVYGIANPSKYENEVEDKNVDTKKCPKCGFALVKYIANPNEKNDSTYYCCNCSIGFNDNLKPIASSLEIAIFECEERDIFFLEVIRRYFAEDVNFDDNTAAELLRSVAKDKELFNEFTREYLINKSYDIKDPIIVCGITAKELASKNPKKSAIEVYAMLSKLKNF